MTGFIIFIHVAACLLLVITILMQSGRGGGLTEGFASAESVFGTQTSSFLVKMTSILAGVFLLTSLSLTVVSTKKSQSLMSQRVSAPAGSLSEPVINAELPPAANAPTADTALDFPQAESTAPEAAAGEVRDLLLNAQE